MIKRKNIIGQTFGELKVLSFSHKIANGSGMYKCKCSCGKLHIAQYSKLISGGVGSCGHRQYAKMVEKNTTHGLTKKSILHQMKIYDAWKDMHNRCANTKFHSYNRYGGRGICVDHKWKNYPTFFEDMYKDMIKHIEKHGTRNTTLDRINTDDNYYKANCRWATKNEQAHSRCNVRLFELNGQNKTMNAWAKEYNIHPETLRHRLDKGVDILTALTTKPSPSRKFT
jgi:hypothetical protein